MLLSEPRTPLCKGLLGGSGWGVLALGMLASGVAGCANPGPPRPPSLQLPALVRDLRVQRVGDRVEASWTTPNLTTDKTRITGPVTAVLCREPGPGVAGVASQNAASVVSTTSGAHLSPCLEAARAAGVPGAIVLVVPLSPDLAAGSARLLGYRVELLNAHGRSAGRSNVAWTLAGKSPLAVGQIEVTGRPEGALITWKPAGPAGASGRMELLRRILVAAPAPAGQISAFHRSGQPRAQPVSPLRVPSTTHSQTAGGPEEVRLAGAVGLAGTGGLLDRTVESGATYSYVAQRVRAVTIAGHALFMAGEASAPVTLLYRDVFPPTPPAGLQAVPAGGFLADAGPPGASGTGPAASIDLSWEPAPEADVAGYNVYRSEVNAASRFIRLNSAPVTVPAYRDATVVAGKQYRYRVTAVDTHNNESGPGAEVEEQVQR